MSENPPSNSSPSSPSPRRRRVRTWQVILLWLVCMAPLLSWGLPTSRTDRLLFGGEKPWKADRYQATHAAEARRERIGGADTDLDPITEVNGIVELTTDEASRAAILLRYRLYSRQPDEMITFMALQRMAPGQFDFDPRLYQYGGGYIYMIGAALGLSALLGLIELSGDAGIYLNEPELFARFYVVARVVTLIFGALALVAAIKLARRAAGRIAGWIAFALVAACPVFITGVLEAKPHLPSVCLLLWAILSALDYQSTGRRRYAVFMGLQTGYAAGLVLTGVAGALLWPVLLLMRGRSGFTRTLRDLAIAGGLALAVYLVTNPYIPYNLLFKSGSLAGNLENSMAMYEVGRISEGFLKVCQLLLESCGPGVLLGGLLALAWLYARWPRQADVVSVSGLGMLVLCVAIGAGKPAEFARFLLLPAILFAIGSAILLATLAAYRLGWGVLATLVVLAVLRAPAYLHSFYVDAHFQSETRHLAAQYVSNNAPPTDSIGLVQEPAPYATPPLDFAHRDILLLPPRDTARVDHRALPQWIVLTADDATVYRQAWWQPHYQLAETFGADPLQLSRIAWANKPVFVYRRAE